MYRRHGECLPQTPRIAFHGALQDGPGIRTTVFLKGCPLRCAWCHNPEGMSPVREVWAFHSRCCGCEACRRACPHALEVAGKGALAAQVPHCELCGACVDACPADCRRIVGEQLSVAEVLRQVLRDRIFYEDSGGGVTFSGGEPLMQLEFLKALLVACREQGLHTAVDTCGMAAIADLQSIAPLTDLLLYDLKFLDEEAHQRYTGASNRQILQNLGALGAVHRNIWVRVPLILGTNDHPAELRAIAQFVAGIPGVRQVNLLPYHPTGRQKWHRLGRNGEAIEFRSPSAEALAGAASIFQDAGLATKAGG